MKNYLIGLSAMVLCSMGAAAQDALTAIPGAYSEAKEKADKQFIQLEILSGTEDGFGLGVKFDPKLPDRFNFELSANLVQ